MEQYAEVALLVLVTVPGLRVLLKSPVRREAQAQPVLAAVALLVMGAVVIAGMWAMRHSDGARRAVVVSATVVALLFWIRARPMFGHARGLPPGSLGLARSLDAITDEDFYAKAATQWGPVFKMSQFHRPVVCIADLATGQELLDTQPDAFVQTAWGFNPLVPGGYVEFMDGDLHARTRQRFAGGFREDVLSDSRANIVAVIRRELASFGQTANSREASPEAMLDHIAFACVLRIVLGVESSDPRAATLAQLFAALDRSVDTVLPPPSSVRSAFREIVHHVSGIARASDSGPDSKGRSVLSEAMRDDAGFLDDPTLVGNLVLMVSNGRDILRGVLRWALKMIAEHDQWVRDLRAVAAETPASTITSDTLTNAFVLEVLRTHGSPYVYRVVARTVWLGPFRIPKGWLLRLCVREAHHSAAKFPEPARFNPGRFAAHGQQQAALCPFGHGPHACLADQLTIYVATTLVRELALGFDTRIVNDGQPENRNRHWQFWRPSRQLRIGLRAIG